MTSVLLDTNILLRLLEPAAPEHSTVQTAIRNLSARGTTFVIAPQVLVEFWVVATRPVEVNGFGWEPSVVASALGRLRDRFPLLIEGPNCSIGGFHSFKTNRYEGRALTTRDWLPSPSCTVFHRS